LECKETKVTKDRREIKAIRATLEFKVTRVIKDLRGIKVTRD